MFFISGAKERNPAAAVALQEKLRVKALSEPLAAVVAKTGPAKKVAAKKAPAKKVPARKK
jgi:hypothetical protein